MTSWPRVPLGELTELCYGKALPMRSRREGNIPVFGSNGPTGFHNAALVTEPTIVVGRKGSVGAVHYVRQRCYPIDTTYFVRRRQPELLDLEYLHIALKHLDLSRLRTMTGVPGLNREDAYRETIPLPPLLEQRRIVDILNRANGIRRLRREALDKARQLIPALFVDMFGDPATNPKGWPEALFGKVISFSRYGPRFHNRNYSPAGARILRTTDISFGGTIDWRSSPTLDVSDPELRRYALRPNTMLFTRTGATIGKCALFSGGPEPCIAGAYLIECGLSDAVVGHYVLAFFSSSHGQAILLRGSRAMAQPNINVPTIKSIKLLLPPMRLQAAFASHVADVQAIIAQQERMAGASDQLVTSLMVQLFDGGISTSRVVA